jgi:hypothetical protein
MSEKGFVTVSRKTMHQLIAEGTCTEDDFREGGRRPHAWGEGMSECLSVSCSCGKVKRFTDQDLRELGWVKAPLAGAPSVEDKIKSAIEYEVGYLGNMHERLSMNPKKDAMLIVSIRAHEHFLAKLDELMEGSGKPKGDLHE